ncbi:MAG: DinB family protein [Thermoanaerobaculia bacterium]
MPAFSPGPVLEPRYAAALGDDDPVFVMAQTPDRVRRLIRGLTERQLETRPAPGKWCIKEIVAHLADSEVILGSRYRFVGAHDRPALPSTDQDAFVERLGPMNAKAADLADDFAMARAVNLGLFERLPGEAWDRVGLHAERGEESIRYMVAMYAGHDRIHLAQIETIRTGLFPRAGKNRAKRKSKPRPSKTSRKRTAKRR